MITAREKSLLHIYPDLSGLSDPDRRDILKHCAGVDSTREARLDQEGFERAMASYEQILWDRVDRGVIKDPRLCTVCGRALKADPAGPRAACPEGCESRRVYSWTRDYWRRRLPAAAMANSRQIWKLRQIWTLLQDYLPEAERNDVYLAGIIAHCTPGGTDPKAILEPGNAVAWQRVTSQQAHLATEAVKDRIRYAIREAGKVPF